MVLILSIYTALNKYRYVLRIIINNTYRILHGIPRWVSVREAQVVNHIYTRDVQIPKFLPMPILVEMPISMPIL